MILLMKIIPTFFQRGGNFGQVVNRWITHLITQRFKYCDDKDITDEDNDTDDDSYLLYSELWLLLVDVTIHEAVCIAPVQIFLWWRRRQQWKWWWWKKNHDMSNEYDDEYYGDVGESPMHDNNVIEM